MQEVKKLETEEDVHEFINNLLQTNQSVILKGQQAQDVFNLLQPFSLEIQTPHSNQEELGASDFLQKIFKFKSEFFKLQFTYDIVIRQNQLIKFSMQRKAQQFQQSQNDSKDPEKEEEDSNEDN